MKTSEIAHIWAHATGPSNKTCGNVSHSCGVLYSYSTAIGQIAKIKGKRIAFLNMDNYSVSTSKHQGYARYAVNHIETLPVHGVSMGDSCLLPRHSDYKAFARRQVKHLTILAANELKAAKRRRSERAREWDIISATKHLQDARHYRDLFDRRIRLPEDLEAVCRHVDKIEKTEKARSRRAEKVAAEKAKMAIPDWIAGERYYMPHVVNDVYLRVSATGGEQIIETSKHASIPYDLGKRCFEFIVKNRAKGWRANGEKFALGNYSLDSVNECGIVAGCHVIKWSEIERFAKSQGWQST